MAKYLKRAERKLKQRQESFDAIADKRAFKRPGSMNPKKQWSNSSLKKRFK